MVDINILREEVKALEDEVKNYEEHKALLEKRDTLLKKKREHDWNNSKVGKVFSGFVKDKSKDDKGGLF